jgi:hypothetical protein
MAKPGHATAGEIPASRPPAKTIVSGLGLALLTILTQIVLRRVLAPGEFGTANALFGVVIVLVVPLAAFSAVLRRRLSGAHAAGLHVPVLNRAAVAWGVICLVILFIALPPLKLPRLSLQFFMLITVASGLLAVCGRPATPARWCAIVGLGAAVLRLMVSAWGGANWPTAESAVGAFLLAALLAGLPALRDPPGEPAPAPIAAAWKILRPALVPCLAAISVAGALALFTNADRIAAQVNLGTADSGNIVNLPAGAEASFVDYSRFDAYQTAGLCARGLLWLLLPLLGLFYRARAASPRTTYASLRWFWIYLGALFLGAVFLVIGAPVVNALFPPHDPPAEKIDPTGLLLTGFTGAFFLLGLVQAIAVFALASRRYVECFTLAACSVAYTVFLFDAGHQPQIMTSVMAGGALMSLALVLFVGVVRYARSHP